MSVVVFLVTQYQVKPMPLGPMVGWIERSMQVSVVSVPQRIVLPKRHGFAPPPEVPSSSWNCWEGSRSLGRSAAGPARVARAARTVRGRWRVRIGVSGVGLAGRGGGACRAAELRAQGE